MSGHHKGILSALGEPDFAVQWQPRAANFLESLNAAVRGPSAPKDLPPSASFFRLRLAARRLPGRGIAGSFVWHLILLSVSVPVSQLAEPAPKINLPQIEITWYGPTTDVAPLVAPVGKKPEPERKSPRTRAKKLIEARAYNPKTTVIFKPPRPTNTRQILIRPDAPPTPPTFLPALPNVISWTGLAAPKPAIPVNPHAIVAKRPHAITSMAPPQAPKLGNATPPTGPLDIAADSRATPRPPMPVVPSAIHAVRVAPPPKSAAIPAASPPAYTPAENRFIALSLAPNGNLPPPPGNASAPISIGPVVRKNAPLLAEPATANGEAGANGPAAPELKQAVPGPEGLLILHNGAAPAPPPAAPARLLLPQPRLLPSKPRPMPGVARGNGELASAGIVPHDLAHEVLGTRPIHKLLINMPDLTSATGSWVLDFAAMPDEQVPLEGDILAPLPVVKVDPRYPPEMIEERVEGEVVLYAVIGQDGTVSHIRVVKSVDPRLDKNAEDAFAQWKFRPALVDNQAVALEVLVHIPFRIESSSPR